MAQRGAGASHITNYTLAPANDASRFGNEVREFAKPIQMPKREFKDTKVLVKK